MSYTACSFTASCTVADFKSANEAALSVYYYLVNHPDEIPSSLDADDTDSDECVTQIESYLSLDGDKLTISCDTESDFSNHDSEVFDFLVTHFACLQSSLYMELHWSSIDSRTGTSGGTYYYNRQGKEIDIHSLLSDHLS